MSRLLRAVLRVKGNARIFYYDQLNLHPSEVFMGTLNCSSWTSNQAPSGRESTSAQLTSENKTLYVDRETRERERIMKMRCRMRQLHGLDRENPTYDDDAMSQYQNQSKVDNTDSESSTLPPLTSEPDDVVLSNMGGTEEEEGLARKQSDFIRRLKDGPLPNRKMDKLVSVPFGLVRVDSMNLLQVRPKNSKKPGEALNEIENVFKLDEKFGQANKKFDQSELKYNRRGLILDEALAKGDITEPNHSELESRQYQSDVNRNQSELRSYMSESHRELTVDQTHNRAPPTSRTKAASSPVSFSTSEIRSQHMSQKKTSENPEPVGTNVFDQQYFDGRITDDQSPAVPTEAHSLQSENVFEEQYFGMSNSLPEKNAQLPEEVSGFSSLSDIQNFSTDFTEPKKDRHTKSFITDEPVDNGKNAHSIFDEQYFEQTNKGQINENLESVERNNAQLPKSGATVVFPKLDKPDQMDDTIFHETVTRREVKQRSIPFADVNDPKTAYDMAMKIRLEKKGKLTTASTAAGTHPRESKWSGRLDSKGFRILTDQVVDMQYLTEDVVVNILRDSIIYEDDNVIAIDKPYGLPSHGGPGVHHSVGKFLGPLAAKVDRTGQLTTLHLVHRLDKETTGVMVLAKSQQTAEFLLALFKKRMVVKRYWAITKGIPNPTEGVIDIPMAEGSVEDRYRMELRPLYRDEKSFLRRATDSLSGERREAVTNFKVLSSANGVALVECQPETGVKHQIRCHLAYGLNTPILGDHKYSHYSKMAPQRLYPEILQRLGIRQSKVRHLPMHLHARALVLPEFRDGRNLFLSARLPRHFMQNLKWLQLDLPQ